MLEEKKTINKKRNIFYSKPLKHWIGTSSNGLCLERVFCGAKLKDVDFFFEDRHITKATVGQETLQTLASQHKLKLVNKKLYGLGTTDRFEKCKKFIQNFSYLKSNHYQKKYLGARDDLFFKFAKPYELIFYLLHFHHTEDTKNIVDYFCGSGSTADAVIRYNYQYKKSFDCYMCDINHNLKEHHKIRFKYVFDELKITDYEIIENEPNELLINYSFSATQMPQTARISTT